MFFVHCRVGEQTPKWYKFDDGEVSECKMEDDEEMKNQCFGGEYLGEVFDHMLKRCVDVSCSSVCPSILAFLHACGSLLLGRMSYRRQKRWWNAYILIYERMEEYDSGVQKEMSLTRSMQDLTISQYTIDLILIALFPGATGG